MCQYKDLDTNQVQHLIDQSEAVIVDIRSAQAYQADHLPGAVNISHANWLDTLNALEFDTPILVYCAHGIASHQAAQQIADLGFEQVFNLTGGYSAWKQQP